ncbi:hypothetical protein C8R47DRAFT_1171075 [Mycena vitilis]|nr:hypothetical protein C8R47DRAFT_1171075 [Mycena vitilis]
MAYDAVSPGTTTNDPQARQRRKLWVLAGMGLFLFVSLVFARRPFAQPMVEQFRPEPHALIPAPSPPRIYLRAGDVRREGRGHFKHSIVFSNALHTSLLLAANDPYELHPYSTSELYNGERDFSLDVSRACRIQAYVPHDEREPLVRAFCEGQPWAIERMDQIRADMAECTSIVDTEDSSVLSPRKTTNDLNGCVMGWVRERLAPPPLQLPLTAPLARPITVGPGEDMATHAFYGSWSLPNIVRVLADLRKYAHPHGIVLTIAMQNARAAVLAFLNEPVYTLLDSDDAFTDLRVLGQSDVLLVMAHLIAMPGLTLVEGGGFHKFINTSGFGRHVVSLDNYTPESLQLVVERI